MATPMEEFLRLNAQWGAPLPGAARPPALPQSPYLPPQAAPGQFPMPMMSEAPLQTPMTDAPVEEAAPTGYTPAAFAPPGQITAPRNADIFGDFTSRLGLRAPTATPTGPLGAPPALTADPRRLQAQPGQMSGPMAQPAPTVNPMLAKRYPSSNRTRQLVDAARARRGY